MFIEFGWSFIEFGWSFIEFGWSFIEFGWSFIEFGWSFIEFGWSFIELEVSFIEFKQWLGWGKTQIQRTTSDLCVHRSFSTRGYVNETLRKRLKAACYSCDRLSSQ
ncbi:hypothetical protein LC607_15975 [Nostoc sp. CHAB 5824]|nr:hypothetical protein [Nostoc sp. CHAB 5824]